MQAIGALWITLYLFDNAVRVGTLLDMSRWLPGSTHRAVRPRDVHAHRRRHLGDGRRPLVPRFSARQSRHQGLEPTSGADAFVDRGAGDGLRRELGGGFGLPPRSLLGFGGLGGLTFGLAAKDLVSNFIGGSMLAIVRPFSPGEKIYLMAVGGRFRGTNEPSVGGYLVSDIGWYQTTLIPKDTRPTTVPNGFFLGANVINISRQTARVIIVNVRVRYEDLETVPAMTAESGGIPARARRGDPAPRVPYACICATSRMTTPRSASRRTRTS